MNHLEFAASESAALIPTAWEHWVGQAEKLAGHDLDGDQDTDGYSLGFAYDAWRFGKTAQQYVDSIIRPTDGPTINPQATIPAYAHAEDAIAQLLLSSDTGRPVGWVGPEQEDDLGAVARRLIIATE